MVSCLPTTCFIEVLKRSKEVDALGRKISKAIELIDSVLDDLTEEAVALSFNGGKDCTVLLHLFAATLYARHASEPNSLRPHRQPLGIPSSSQSSTLESMPTSSISEASSSNATTSGPLHKVADSTPAYPSIKSVYITAANHFSELDTFTDDSIIRYGMDLYRFGGDMKAALREYLECGGGRGVKGILVGTRTGDPNGRVKPIDPTDPNWPQFLRIHPILDWTYSEIWAFLRELAVPYCHLYDEGYTSLGSTKNTIPNPLLKRPDGTYEPAWKLTDGSKERGGRLDASP